MRWTIHRKIAALFSAALILIAAVAGLILLLNIREIPRNAPDYGRRVRKEVIHLLPGFLTMAVVSLTGLLASRWVWRPLKDLAAVARAVGAGDTTLRAAANRCDELGEVATALNLMLDSLEASRLAETRRLGEVEALHAVASAVAQSLVLDEMLTQSLDQVLSVTGAEGAEVFLWDVKREALVLAAHRGAFRESFYEKTQFKPGEGFPGLVAASGEAIVVADLAEDSRFLRRRFVEAAVQAFACVPMRANGAIVGTLGVARRSGSGEGGQSGNRTIRQSGNPEHGHWNHQSARAPECQPQPEGGFNKDELRLIEGVAAEIALGVENARLLEDVRRQMAEQQRALARLVQSARMVSVGFLAAGVAHDINNPLCIISNHLQLLRLRGDYLTPEVQGALHTIEANVRRMAASIRALLEYAGGRPGQRQRSDLNEVAGRMVFLIQTHPLYQHLRVVTDLATDLPPVDLDRAAWEQVILELLGNAREAVSHGGTVTITTRLLPAGNCRLQIADCRLPHSVISNVKSENSL